jgi:HEAT repeats
LTPTRANHPDPISIVAKLPIRQRISALGDALLIVPPVERSRIALMLIELASFNTRAHPTHPHHAIESAASPMELITRLPMRWRMRSADDAALALGRGWGALSDEMKVLAAGLGRDRLLGVARALAKDPDPRARLSAIAIAHDSADPGFGKIVGSLLPDEHQTVRKAADKALMRMTMVMLDHLPDHLLGEELAKIAATPRIVLPVDPAVLALERCILLRAIADAAWSFAAHRCRSPLLAALLVMDRAVATPMEREISARMRRLLSERNHPSHSPLRTVLRRTPCPILRERALRWLTLAPISTAAIDRLACADSIEEHEVVLRRAHLAIRPARGARLKSLHHKAHPINDRNESASDGPLPDRKIYDQLSDPARLGLIRFSSLISIDDLHKRALLEPTLADPSVQIRFSACASGASSDLSDYLFDIDANVARHAAIRWSSLGYTPPRVGAPAWVRRAETARVNTRSPHSWVRRVADEESERLSIMCPSSPVSRVAARRLYKHDPSRFVRSVRDHLSNPDTRASALMLIRLMGVEHRFEIDLISITQSDSSDAVSRATAVMALGAIGSPSARYILEEALEDPDARIRANAAESIACSPDQLLELKADPHHRVRASAIRRVIRESDPSHAANIRNAGHSLLEMLFDGRPMHRLAATWAAQRTLTLASRELMGVTWKPLVNEIETLAATDQDVRVRSRASRCIHRLSADLHLENESRQHRVTLEDRAHYPQHEI